MHKDCCISSSVAQNMSDSQVDKTAVGSTRNSYYPYHNVVRWNNCQSVQRTDERLRESYAF